MLWAADKLDAREQANSARQEHSEGPKFESSLRASTSSGGIPPSELPAS